ncbi:MAG: hypothetical protein PVS2B2_01680 [Candidatus Acidiferrum sp.]
MLINPFRVLFLVLCAVCCGVALPCPQALAAPGDDDEIVANLAGGRVIVHVANEMIVLAAIDHPLEIKSVPPRLMDLDGTHVAILLGATEWQVPAQLKPVRLDRNFARLTKKDLRYQSDPGEAEPDLEEVGVSFLEELRPLVAQLHHKIDLRSDEPIFEVVIIGYAPNDYGPEVWVVEYHVEQEEAGTRGEYLQTRLLRPHYTQLYPPEKHQPRTLIETRYPANLDGPTLLGLIQSDDARIAKLRGSEARFAKVLDFINKGHAQKSNGVDAADFLRAVLPLIAGKESFILATMDQQRGFDWIVPPEEPAEASAEDKHRPPDAPTLRRKPKP